MANGKSQMSNDIFFSSTALANSNDIFDIKYVVFQSQCVDKGSASITYCNGREVSNLRVFQEGWTWRAIDAAGPRVR